MSTISILLRSLFSLFKSIFDVIQCAEKAGDPIEITLNIVRQILDGLHYIHSENFIHHDLKPSNIVIGCDDWGKLRIELADFGLACWFKMHLKKSFGGSKIYAAPEQLDKYCHRKVLLIYLNFS